MHGSRNFFKGGSGPTARNQPKRVFFFCFFFVLNLFYSLQRGSNGFITEKIIVFQRTRGAPTFSRGVQLFPREVKMLISIETQRNCDFQGEGGSRLPFPPLDPHMKFLKGKK